MDRAVELPAVTAAADAEHVRDVAVLAERALLENPSEELCALLVGASRLAAGAYRIDPLLLTDPRRRSAWLSRALDQLVVGHGGAARFAGELGALAVIDADAALREWLVGFIQRTTVELEREYRVHVVRAVAGVPVEVAAAVTRLTAQGMRPGAAAEVADLEVALACDVPSSWHDRVAEASVERVAWEAATVADVLPFPVPEELTSAAVLAGATFVVERGPLAATMSITPQDMLALRDRIEVLTEDPRERDVLFQLALRSFQMTFGVYAHTVVQEANRLSPAAQQVFSTLIAVGTPPLVALDRILADPPPIALL